jgi:hypothetical protein
MFSQGEKLECAYPIIKETIPKSSLGYGANNKYPEVPPLMSDGRSIIGGWQPESTINADLINSNNIKSNWQYREYLTKNSKDIMEYNFRETCNDVGYFKRPIDIPSIQSNLAQGIENTPYKYKSVLDQTKPLGYESTDLKQLYLTREQLEARKVSPVVTQEYIMSRRGNRNL